MIERVDYSSDEEYQQALEYDIWANEQYAMMQQQALEQEERDAQRREELREEHYGPVEERY